jgi:hypothetical protein
VHPYANLQLKMLFNIPQVGGFRKVIGRFGRDIINAGDPHQIAGLFDTFDHNIQLILNGRDRIPELTAEYRIQMATIRVCMKLIKWNHSITNLSCYFKLEQNSYEENTPGPE